MALVAWGLGGPCSRPWERGRPRAGGRAGGGLSYRGYDELAAALDLLRREPPLADALGGRARLAGRTRVAGVLDRYERICRPGSAARPRRREAGLRDPALRPRGERGAEMHCRLLAERLARRHEVEVFATRALDYLEWRNHYPAGHGGVNGIPVHRHSVKRGATPACSPR